MLGEETIKENNKPISVSRPKKLSPEDELLEELTRVAPEDVKPAQVKPIVKKVQSQSDGLGPVSGRSAAKPQKTIVIKKQNQEEQEEVIDSKIPKPRTIKINKNN